MSETKFIICPVCGQENSITNDFCGGCGGKLDGGIVRSVTSSEKSEDLIPSLVDNKVNAQRKNKKSHHAHKKESVKKLPNIRLVYFLLAFGIITALNLFIAGVFDSPTYVAPTLQNKLPEMTGGADLSKLKEISSLETSVANNPGDFKSILTLAHLLNDSGFYDKAIRRYQDYLKIRSNEPDVLVDMGVCYYQLNDYSNAISTMNKALEIDSKHQIAHFNIGIVNFAAGNKNEATQWWKKTVALNSNTNIAKKAQELINKHQ